MPAESAADRLALLSVDEFGETATYSPAAGAAAALRGIFNDPHLGVALEGGEARTSDSQPTFTVRAADLPAGAAGGDAGDTLALAAGDLHGAATYAVIDIQRDGAGMATLILGA